MAVPANAAVRERRRRTSPLDVERVNVLKALTAAEHSRRQFILNFAASRDTRLLIPGQKSDAVKAAETWAAHHLEQNGDRAPNSELFKYMVDAHLWSTHVGDDVEFPFAFMRAKLDAPLDAPTEVKVDPETELQGQEIVIDTAEIIPVATTVNRPRDSVRAQPRSDPSTPQSRGQRSTKQQPPAEVSATADGKRSMSLTSFDDLKVPRLTPEKFPFFVRLGRSWSRRLSSGS